MSCTNNQPPPKKKKPKCHSKYNFQCSISLKPCFVAKKKAQGLREWAWRVVPFNYHLPHPSTPKCNLFLNKKQVLKFWCWNLSDYLNFAKVVFIDYFQIYFSELENISAKISTSSYLKILTPSKAQERTTWLQLGMVAWICSPSY